MVKLLLEFILLMWLSINYINAENCQGHDRVKFLCPDGQDKTKERCCFSVVPGERYVGLYCCSMQEYESINLDNDYEGLISTESPTIEPWI
ncbi:uncharacterized protein LOC107267071 isoform X2 [Cephus cinctus]|uniref:Uncharacterized protein LOC107267071 isoform X2 n=1 Tax=Cephus cinctus TaxID=211228 RepID=A0AAJ7BTC3_CEPCN|nr:uncharacterized protein LOC107267071 isoform X2 [Cephus cinctus]